MLHTVIRCREIPTIEGAPHADLRTQGQRSTGQPVAGELGGNAGRRRQSVHLGGAGLATSATSVNFHGWGDHVMEFFAIGNAVVPIDGAAGLPDPSLTLEFN